MLNLTEIAGAAQLEHSIIAIGSIAMCFCVWGCFVALTFYGSELNRRVRCVWRVFHKNEARRDAEKYSEPLPPSYGELGSRGKEELPNYEEIYAQVIQTDVTSSNNTPSSLQT